MYVAAKRSRSCSNVPSVKLLRIAVKKLSMTAVLCLGRKGMISHALPSGDDHEEEVGGGGGWKGKITYICSSTQAVISFATKRCCTNALWCFLQL